jgi:hypothetical protein
VGFASAGESRNLAGMDLGLLTLNGNFGDDVFVECSLGSLS